MMMRRRMILMVMMMMITLAMMIKKVMMMSVRRVDCVEADGCSVSVTWSREAIDGGVQRTARLGEQLHLSVT